MCERSDGPSDALDELPDADALDWTALQSLLAANAETTQALESYLARVQYRDEGGDDLSPVKDHIREAIDRHEDILEALELALAAVEKREQSD